jgi:phage terminase large subunit-like protein
MAGFADFCKGIGLELEPFQRRIAKAAAGPEREFVALLPRGNGKSTLLAAIGVHHLLEVQKAKVYVAASSREQARIIFEIAAEFVRTLDHPNLILRHHEIRYCEDPEIPKVFSRHMRVLAADAPRLHGLTPSLCLVDELHAHASDEVYIALSTAAIKRPGSKLLIISTAGSGPDTPLGRLRARALAAPDVRRTGARTDARGPDIRMLEWAVPDGADITDMKQVKRANPGSWLTIEALHQQAASLPPLAFARYHANQWVGPEGAWLPPGAWNLCVGQPEFTPGEDIWVGVDVGGERSATAVTWINPGLHVGCAIYHGDQGVLDAIDKTRELAGRFNVREVCFDPWRFSQGAQELEAEGITVTAFPQSDARMIPASDRLYRAIVEQRLTLPGNHELRAHAHAAVARHSRRGWRIDKATRADNIDSIIALCMALEAAENQPAPVELLGWL